MTSSRKEKIAYAASLEHRRIRDLKTRCRSSLVEFIKEAWPILEPSMPYEHGKHIDAMALHLEHILGGQYEGEITRLCINIPPGHMKSLMSVFYNCWLWGPCGRPDIRFLRVSHSQSLAIRDTVKTRRLVLSDWFQRLWPTPVTGDQNSKIKFELEGTGWVEACAANSVTGARGDILWLDDINSVTGAASDAERETTVNWFLEAAPTRLNRPGPGPNGEPPSAIVNVQQRLHEQDITGVILDKQLGYTHLMLPMEFDPDRKCITEIGFEDWRRYPGDILFPERFSRETIERDKIVMGPYAVASQFQMSPSPRGGGIIKREHWMLYDEDEAKASGVAGEGSFPDMDYVVVSCDPAYGEKHENDPSGVVVLGVWQKGGGSARAILTRQGVRSEIIDDRDTIPKVMLLWAANYRDPVHGPDLVPEPGETELEFKRRQREGWGLVEKLMYLCEKFKANKLLVEAKANGITVGQEIRRLNRNAAWNVELINPGKLDKVARAHAVSPIFANGTVYAPNRDWADMVIDQCASFPKAKHDDLVDAVSQALTYLRERGFLHRPADIAIQIEREAAHKRSNKPVYNV